jgi:hypothetical protein
MCGWLSAARRNCKVPAPAAERLSELPAGGDNSFAMHGPKAARGTFIAALQLKR